MQVWKEDDMRIRSTFCGVQCSGKEASKDSHDAISITIYSVELFLVIISTLLVFSLLLMLSYTCCDDVG